MNIRADNEFREGFSYTEVTKWPKASSSYRDTIRKISCTPALSFHV